MLEEPVSTQIYLVAPPLSAGDSTGLAAIAGPDVASLLVDLSGFVEAEAQALSDWQSQADEAGIPLVASGEAGAVLVLAKRFGLDGVHLSGSPKQVGWARKQLGGEAIVGFDAGLSRQDALVAAEAGADYVMLGPLVALDPDLPLWWQMVIETPLVIDAGTQPQAVNGIADFILVRDVLSAPDPKAALQKYSGFSGA